MNRNHTVLLNICGVGAQLSWLYGWASFLIFSFFQRIYPLPETLGIFSLAAFLTVIARRRTWRAVQAIGMHLAGLAGAALWVLHAFYYRREPLWDTDWLIGFFNRPRSQLEWFLLIFVCGYTLVFWTAGLGFANEVRSYPTACSRFDRGMIAFFALFLVKLTLHTRMGVEFHDSTALLMIFPFFIFSLMEIGLARSQGSGPPKAYLAGYSVVGVLASFTVGAFIIGAAVFMFFLPYLKMASVAGYDLLQTAAAPLEPILIAVIRFIFGYAKWRTTGSDFAPQTGTADPVTSSPWMLMVHKILMWGGWVLLTVVGLAVAFLVLWYLIRWLFKKPGRGEETGDQWNLLSWWRRLVAFLQTCYLGLLRTHTKRTAFQFYAALVRWGRYGGFRQKPHETPLEYGRRLCFQFPQLKDEITLIVEMLHWEVYGENSLVAQQISKLRQAWQKLHSPLRLPLRIKSIMKKP